MRNCEVFTIYPLRMPPRPGDLPFLRPLIESDNSFSLIQVGILRISPASSKFKISLFEELFVSLKYSKKSSIGGILKSRLEFRLFR